MGYPFCGSARGTKSNRRSFAPLKNTSLRMTLHWTRDGERRAEVAKNNRRSFDSAYPTCLGPQARPAQDDTAWVVGPRHPEGARRGPLRSGRQCSGQWTVLRAGGGTWGTRLSQVSSAAAERLGAVFDHLWKAKTGHFREKVAGGQRAFLTPK